MMVHWMKTQLTLYQLRVGTWRKGSQFVDGMAILHKMQSTALGTVVDLSHGFNDLLVSMTIGIMMRSSLSLTLTRMYL